MAWHQPQSNYVDHIYWNQEKPGPKLSVNMTYTNEADFRLGNKWQDNALHCQLPQGEDGRRSLN